MIRSSYHRAWCKIRPVSSTARAVPPPPPPLDPRAHRALGSASRVRLLEAIRAEGPLEAEQLAERVGLHLNTVRAHLNVLREAGLVGARSLPSAGPGRPRLAFAATDMFAGEGHPGAYRLLAGILTASLDEREDGRERATSAGHAAGRQLAKGPRPWSLGVMDRRSRVLALLDRLGFAPRPAGEVRLSGAQVIGLHRCPFSDLAEDGSSIVCAAHRGLIQGAFEELGGKPDLVRLIPFASPGLCTVHFDQS